MKGPVLILVALLLTPAIGAFVAASIPPTPKPLQLTSADVPSWLVGDTWTFSLAVDFRSGSDWLRGGGNVSLTVAQRFEADVDGSYLYLYNSTTTGDLYGQGQFTDPNSGATIPLTIDSGALAGYLWNERGDLAAVKTNQTFTASGSAVIPIFGSRPIAIQGAVTALMRPPEEDLDFPIVPGDTWQGATTANMTGYARITVDLPTPFPDQTIVQPLNMDVPESLASSAGAAETVSVPAGTFEALRVHSASSDRWYAPNASNYVRLEIHDATSPTQYTHLWTNLTSYALATPNIGVSVSVVPAKVAPGGSFDVVANTTAAAAVVKVIIPVTNFTAMGTTNASGGFRTRLAAPLNDDNTPANTDIGSHGVLVEVTKGAQQGYGAATISLLPADLTVSGLIATPVPVGDGLATDLRATVSVTTDVPAGGPVDVTFVSEDVDMNADGVLDNPIDVYCARGSCIGTATVGPVLPGSPVVASVTWTPSPPTIPANVPVSAVVDPRNQCAEVSETNNIAVAVVRVEGPNLTPSNVTVDDGTTLYVFDDPASLGFVSPVIDLPQGRTVDLIVRVRNTGVVNASRAATLALYNTTTLNGTGDVPFFQTGIGALAASQETGPIAARWTAPLTAGPCYVNVTADHGDALRESSEADNTFVLRFNVSAAPALPDLVPVEVTVPPKASVGRTAWITARVENRGAGDASAFHVAFLNDSEPTPFAVVPLGALQAGATSSIVSAPWSATALGAHSIRVVVDYNDEVQESNETNNTGSGTVTVVGVPVTTLTIGSPNVPGTDTVYILPTTPLTFDVIEYTGMGATIWYEVDAGPWTSITAGAPLTLSSGPHTVSFNSTDLLGGVEPTRSRSVFVDDVPPETTPAVSDLEAGKSVALAPTDSASGVDYTEYRIDNGTWTRYGTPFPIVDPGAHYVEFRSVDRLGNLELAKAIVVRVEAGGGQGAVPFNLKPILALVFAIVLFLAGAFASPSNEAARRRRWFLTVVAPPVVLEAITGIASLGVPEMAVPGGSLGLPIDVALLVIGLLVILFSRRRALRPV